MNKTLRKLDRIGERMWILATMIAAQAASLSNEGKGLAVVAEETRNMAVKITDVVEKTMSEGDDIEKDKIIPLAFQLNLLALNTAIESSRIGYRGKQAAVYAEDTRNLANEILCLFDAASAKLAKHSVNPFPAHLMSTVSQSGEFLRFSIGGIPFVETLANIKEVCGPFMERKDGHVMLRNMELPLIDGYKMLGKTKDEPTYIIVQTPWAEQNKTYAVAADISSLFFSPIGKPVDTPHDMPLAKYVRECWENEHGEPFYFMDWTKMAR